MATVLRVAFGRLPQPQRDAELRRIFGSSLHIEVLAGRNDLTVIIGRACELNVDAVILDVAPEGTVERLGIEVPTIPVLRPIRGQKEIRNRYGERTVVEAWVGYGVMNKQGDVERLDDGALDPSRRHS